MKNIEGLEFNKSYTTKVKITLLDGNIIEENGTDILDYTISDAQDLKELANQVNSGNKTFEGETILQISNVDLSSVCGSSIGDWNPIGAAATPTTTWFNGTYNGNEKEITNIYINNNQDRTIGLFGFLGYKGIIKGVIIYGDINQDAISRASGGIVGRNEGKIQNCINNANIIANSSNVIGGIVGSSASNEEELVSNNNSKVENNVIVKSCTNKGSISGNTYVGGIYGSALMGTLELCKNTGNIVSSTSIAGGIAGQSKINITNSKNTGNVTTNGNPSNQTETQGTGGIVGRSIANISFSSNEGKITSKGYFAGGILGVGSENTSIDQCYNIGSIEVEKNAAGGIVGLNAKNISNCYNYLDIDKTISAVYNVGGIMGNSSNTAVNIENCYNIGENITGGSNASILAACYVNGTKVDNCYYLDTSSLNGLGVEVFDGLEINNIYKKSLDNFKLEVENSNSVAYLLNGNSSSGVWKQNSEINGGLPILSWQLDELEK